MRNIVVEAHTWQIRRGRPWLATGPRVPC